MSVLLSLLPVTGKKKKDDTYPLMNGSYSIHYINICIYIHIYRHQGQSLTAHLGNEQFLIFA